MPASWLTTATTVRAILSRVHPAPPAAAGRVHEVMVAYTACARLGRQPFDLTDADRAALATAAPPVDFSLWSHADLLRLDLLLSRATALGAAACAEAAIACYDGGDGAEQRSWLRGVALLPSPAQFTALVIDACRTNILPVFEAVALGNPFPAEVLPELNFNQMVLKALFNGVPLAGIVGLQERRNAEMARMAGDYAAERRAAGRTVPEDIGLAL